MDEALPQFWDYVLSQVDFTQFFLASLYMFLHAFLYLLFVQFL